MQPEHITAAMFDEAIEELRRKKPSASVDKLRFQRFREGLCIQTMHIGPYSTEPATVERMRAFAAENGFVFKDSHHEIYLGDPQRSAPDKLKTVLRHAVARKA